MMKNRLRFSIKIGTCALLALPCLSLLVMLMTSYEARQICAALPNGAIVGYHAFFDPREPRWTPYPILKRRDGAALLLEKRVFPFFFTETTAYGMVSAGGVYQNRAGFAYRPDVGMVSESKDPALYKKLQSEAGEADAPIFRAHNDEDRDRDGPSRMGLRLFYQTMIQDPVYRREDCPLALFPKLFPE